MAQLQRLILRTNLFQITMVAPKQISAGGTARFRVYFLHLFDGPVNPTGIACKIYEGQQLATLLSTLTVYQDIYGAGSYFADYAVPSTQGTGPLSCAWSGTYESIGTTQGMPVEAIQIFRVVNEMGVVN